MQVSVETGEQQVLWQLARIIDPDFGQDIVSCGFVKGLKVIPQSGKVTFALELTTPACPIKDEFERKARTYVIELPWVKQVSLNPPFPGAQKRLQAGHDEGRLGKQGLKAHWQCWQCPNVLAPVSVVSETHAGPPMGSTLVHTPVGLRFCQVLEGVCVAGERHHDCPAVQTHDTR